MRSLIITLFGALALVAVAFTGARATEWQVLLGPDQVAGRADILNIDIRTPELYAAGHPEGAVNAPYAAWRGPAANPGAPLDDAALSALLSRIGVTRDRPVLITYQGTDPSDFGAAARVYWTLKSAGVSRIAILEGGMTAWVAAGLPLSTTPVAPEPSVISATLSTEWMATREDVAAIIAGTTRGTLVDARPVEFLKGSVKHPAATHAGTLPGARHLAFSSWFDGKDAKTDQKLMGQFSSPAEDGPVVSFCNTGHWAAINWFMMSEVEGIAGAKLYPESMVGWTGAGGAAVTQ